jgi:simple sugar transport system permease protein
MVGGDQVQISLQIPSSIGLALQGAILFSVLGGQVLQDYELDIRRNNKNLK